MVFGLTILATASSPHMTLVWDVCIVLCLVDSVAGIVSCAPPPSWVVYLLVPGTLLCMPIKDVGVDASVLSYMLPNMS